MHLISFQLPFIGHSLPEAPPAWRDSPYICAFADSERHLGHIIKTDRWHAYDATHANPASNEFNYLGAFDNLETAKAVLESVAGWAGETKYMRAAGGLGAGSHPAYLT